MRTKQGVEEKNEVSESQTSSHSPFPISSLSSSSLPESILNALEAVGQEEVALKRLRHAYHDELARVKVRLRQLWRILREIWNSASLKIAVLSCLQLAESLLTQKLSKAKQGRTIAAVGAATTAAAADTTTAPSSLNNSAHVAADATTAASPPLAAAHSAPAAGARM